jgi:hypothetical protein
MRRGVDDETAELRLMIDIRVDDEVGYDGRTFRVRGISPMSASPRRVMLQEVGTGVLVEVRADEIVPIPEAGEESTSGPRP